MTTPNKPTSKKITAKSPGKAGFFIKVKSLATSGRNPLIALVIVAAVSGIGYYGYVNSFANQADPGGGGGQSSQSNPCKNRPNSNACSDYKAEQEQERKKAEEKAKKEQEQKQQKEEQERKQKEADKKKQLEKLQAECESQNRRVNSAGTACGGCVADFSEGPNGGCRKTKDCSAQDRQQNGPFECSGCKNGYAEKDGKCQAIVNCQKENKIQVGNFRCGGCIPNYSANAAGVCVHSPSGTTTTTPATTTKLACEGQNRTFNSTTKQCGGCAEGFTSQADKCVRLQKVDCKAQNRVQKDAYTCGACLSGFSEYAAAGAKTCLDKGEGTLQAQKACANQLRVYNEKTKQCGACIPGYYLNGTACAKSSTLSPAVVKANCKTAHLTYDENANACTNTCLAGYFPKDGKCMTLSEANINEAKETCAKQNRQYINGTSCGPCLVNFIVQANNPTCVAVTTEAINTVKAQCNTAHTVYNAQTNTCQERCVKGYILDANKTCVVPADAAQVKESCNRQHLQYNPTNNTCSTKCVVGYLLAPTGTGACVTPDAVKDYCDAMHLRFDKTQNVCQASCVAGYNKVNGVCLDRAQAQNQMSEKLCRQLGRSWSAETSTCSTTCLDEGGQLVAGTNDAQSYCKAAGEEALGVTTGITEDDCKAQNRVWLVNVKGCSARCLPGYHLGEGNKCEGLTAEGNTVVVCNPATDECKKKCETTGSAADCTTIVRGPVVCDPAKERCSHACEEDKTKEACIVPANPTVPGDGTTQAPDDTSIAVDLNMTESQCALLGREWVSIKDDKGNSVKGCSINTCNYTDNGIATNDAAPYCLDTKTGSAYVSTIAQEECEALHRVWVDAVQGCAQVPMAEGKTDKFINAEQCAAPYTTYIVHQNGQGECFQPNLVDRAQAVAEMFVASLDAVLTAGPATFCELQPGHHWESASNECKKDRLVAGEDSKDPLAIQATAMSSTQVVLAVSGVGTNGYTITYTSGGSEKTVSCSASGAGYGTCFIDGLTPAASYTFKVKVEGAVVAVSNPVTLAAACTPFTVEEVDSTHVLVSWTHVDGASFYTVQRNGGWKSDQQLSGDGSMVMERVNAGHDEWRVNSHNDTGFDNSCARKTL
jgi:hypothetical protein